MKKVKALFYGINGTGLGHISRVTKVAEEMKVILSCMNIESDFHMLTSSEAPQVSREFPTYKFPSKTIVDATPTSNQEYVKNSQFLHTNLVAVLRPDILVMDTAPQGSFGEFPSMMPFAKKTVFINRHTDEAVATSEVFERHIPMYDLILVPDGKENMGQYTLHEDLLERTIFTGSIHGYKQEESYTRRQVREHFHIPDGCKLVYVSAGGGGDRYAEEVLNTIVHTLAQNEHIYVLVGYGPLYNGEKIYLPRVIPFTDTNVRIFFPGIDAAISAAGYNSFEELLAAKIPTAFYAQKKGMDRQDLRIKQGETEHFNISIEDVTPENVQNVVETLLTGKTRMEILGNLDKRKAHRGSVQAAYGILQCHSSIVDSPVQVQKLSLVTLLRKAWAAFAEKNHFSLEQRSRELFIHVARGLFLWQKNALQDIEKSNLLSDSLYAMRNDHISINEDVLLKTGLIVARCRNTFDISDSRLGTLVRSYVQETKQKYVTSYDDFAGFLSKYIEDPTKLEETMEV